MPAKIKTVTITINSQEEVYALFGHRDEHLKFIEKNTATRITSREDSIMVAGERAADVAKMLRTLLKQTRKGNKLEKSDIRYALMLLDESDTAAAPDSDVEIRIAGAHGQIIRPRTPGQRDYILALRTSPLTIAAGPAGTGKTYIAVAHAVSLLQAETVRRIIICRPAVEAGEKLGFLPGDFQQKVDPYLRPIYDALYSMLGFDRCAKLIERGVIEIAPLAFMRGRTLEDAFIILDEAQNTTKMQMKMFLTRLGRNSSAAVTGDVTQTDLPASITSGLVDALDRLSLLSEIKMVRFSKKDVVRHDLVARIIEAYEGDTPTDE